MIGQFASQIRRFLRFCIVGVLAAAVDIGVLSAGLAIGLSPFLARAISLPLAMLAAWQLNRRFTFGASSHSIPREAAAYVSVATAAAAVNYGVYSAILLIFPGVLPALATLVAIGVSMWISFFGFQHLTFARRERSSPTRF